MDGLTTLKHIRQMPALDQVPIIALTALATASDEERCLTAGANAYLSKPVRLNQLATLIHSLLHPQ
jgi:CheY-like chemotaxis protein